MKKVTAFALALVLCLGLLAGCGGNNAQPSSPPPNPEYRGPPPGGPPRGLSSRCVPWGFWALFWATKRAPRGMIVQ